MVKSIFLMIQLYEARLGWDFLYYKSKSSPVIILKTLKQLLPFWLSNLQTKQYQHYLDVVKLIRLAVTILGALLYTSKCVY